MSVSPPPSSGLRLRSLNDAPLIGERAATRGRIATEGGEEHGGVERCYPSSSSFVAAAKPHCPTALDERFATALGACIAGHDAPRIGERAATRGRMATEGSDARAGVKRLSVRAPASRTGLDGGSVTVAATRPT